MARDMGGGESHLEVIRSTPHALPYFSNTTLYVFEHRGELRTKDLLSFLYRTCFDIDEKLCNSFVSFRNSPCNHSRFYHKMCCTHIL